MLVYESGRGRFYPKFYDFNSFMYLAMFGINKHDFSTCLVSLKSNKAMNLTYFTFMYI